MLTLIPQVDLSCLLWPSRILYTHLCWKLLHCILFLCHYAPLAWAFLKTRTMCFYLYLKYTTWSLSQSKCQQTYVKSKDEYWVLVEDSLLSCLFSEVCVLQGRVWYATALRVWGHCRDLAPLPRNVCIHYGTKYTVPVLGAGKPGAKYKEYRDQPASQSLRTIYWSHDVQELWMQATLCLRTSPREWTS